MSLSNPFQFWVVTEQKGNEIVRSLYRWPSFLVELNLHQRLCAWYSLFLCWKGDYVRYMLIRWSPDPETGKGNFVGCIARWRALGIAAMVSELNGSVSPQWQRDCRSQLQYLTTQNHSCRITLSPLKNLPPSMWPFIKICLPLVIVELIIIMSENAIWRHLAVLWVMELCAVLIIVQLKCSAFDVKVYYYFWFS